MQDDWRTSGEIRAQSVKETTSNRARRQMLLPTAEWIFLIALLGWFVARTLCQAGAL